MTAAPSATALETAPLASAGHAEMANAIQE